MFNLGMNQNAQATQQNSTQNNRFYPASQSLNKNADGFVVSINMTQTDITKSRFESRLDWLKQGRPQTARVGGMVAPGLPNFTSQPQAAQGSFMAGGLQQGAFGQQNTQGGLFQTNPNASFAPSFGGPQQNPLQQPPLFSLGGPTQNTQLGMAQQQPTGLFGNQPAQQTGGLFGGQGQQQTGGLFGSALPQQQQGLFGQQQLSLNPSFLPAQTQQPLLGQQSSLFPPQQHQNQIFQPSQMTLQQKFQMYTQLQQDLAIQDYQVNVQIEPDTFEQDYLREMEEQLKINFQPNGYSVGAQQNYNNSNNSMNAQNYSVKISPGSNHLGINISRQYRDNTNRLNRQSNHLSSSSNYSQIQPSQIRSQVFNRNPLTIREDIQMKNDQRQLSSFSTKSKALNKKAFYVSCVSLRFRKLLTFNDLDMSESELANYRVQDLIQVIQSKLLKDEENTYQATYSSFSNQDALQILSNDITLDTLEFNNNTTIALIAFKRVQCLQDQRNIKNPNRPLLVGNGFKDMRPSLKELHQMNDEQLSKVEDFFILTDFGSVSFLNSVDLKRVEIDRVIVFAQDEVCFYPEEDNFKTPPQGQGLNVPCQITFFNFGSAQKEMRDLKQEDFDTFEEKVKQWTASLDMEIKKIDKDNLTVQLQSM